MNGSLFSKLGRRLALAGVGAAALLLGIHCSGPSKEGDSCRNSADCGNGLQCRPSGFGPGTCQPSAISLQVFENVCVVLQCGDNDDCAGSQECSSGFCRCTADGDCGGGQFCESSRCVDCRDGDAIGRGGLRDKAL